MSLNLSRQVAVLSEQIGPASCLFSRRLSAVWLPSGGGGFDAQIPNDSEKTVFGTIRMTSYHCDQSFL